MSKGEESVRTQHSAMTPPEAIRLALEFFEQELHSVNAWDYNADRRQEIAVGLRAALSETGAIVLLKEVRPYLDMIAPSISKTRPLVMVQTKCDAEALAKRIDTLLGESK